MDVSHNTQLVGQGHCFSDVLVGCSARLLSATLVLRGIEDRSENRMAIQLALTQACQGTPVTVRVLV